MSVNKSGAGSGALFEPNPDFDYALARFADGVIGLPESVEEELTAEVYRRAAALRASRTKSQKSVEEKRVPVEIQTVSSAFIFQA